MNASVVTPQRHSYTKVTLISNYHISPIFNLSRLLNIDLGESAYLRDTPDTINSSHLFELTDLCNRNETETLSTDGHIIWHVLDRRVLIEHDSVLIFDAGVLLIGHFDLAIRKRVNLVLLQIGLIVLGLVIEESCLDLCAIVIY